MVVGCTRRCCNALELTVILLCHLELEISLLKGPLFNGVRFSDEWRSEGIGLNFLG